MGSINWSRVIAGGLVAGLILNIGEYLLNEPILGEEWAAAMAALNAQPVGGAAIAWFLVLGFLLGIAMIWLYAAIRPRLGAGPKTAICAGLTVWFFAYFWSSMGILVMGLFPSSLIWISLVWGLVELPVAALLGAYLYQE